MPRRFLLLAASLLLIAPASVLAQDTNAPAAAPATNSAAAAPPRATPVDAATAAAGDASTQPAGTNAAPAAPTGPTRSYTVVKGDNYWKIAKKMYPKNERKDGASLNDEIKKIEDANPETVGKPLKIGQVLVLPQ